VSEKVQFRRISTSERLSSGCDKRNTDRATVCTSSSVDGKSNMPGFNRILTGITRGWTIGCCECGGEGVGSLLKILAILSCLMVTVLLVIS
jgi:hypothetical protein